MFTTLRLAALSVLAATALAAQQPPSLSPQTDSFVTVKEPVVALTNVTVIDGTGPRRSRIRPS
jgi:hypothetical protein